MEEERQKLCRLIECGAPTDEILKQSQELDKYITEYYRGGKYSAR